MNNNNKKVKKNKYKKEELQSIAYIVVFLLLLVPIGFLVFNMNSKDETIQVNKETLNHDILTYSEDNKIAIYNTKDNNYKDSISITTNKAIKTSSNLENPYNIIPYESNSILVTSPNSNEIISYTYKDGKLNEQLKIKTKFAPNKIALNEKKLLISYVNSKQVDLLNLENKEIERTFELKDTVDSIALDDKCVYIANGDNIEIISLTEDKSQYTIFTGAKTTSIYKSTDGYLYAGNIFASDSKNSLLIKIDLNNKNVANILELKKEFPISIAENSENLYVLCKGIQDKTMDGILIIDKSLFTAKKNIATADTPNSMSIINDNFAYVSHDNGQVVVIDLKDECKKISSFVISGIKAIYTLSTK